MKKAVTYGWNTEVINKVSEADFIKMHKHVKDVDLKEIYKSLKKKPETSSEK